jgi:thioredoxin 1
VLDFYTDWCGPCKKIAPVYHQLSIEHPGIVFCKIDGDVADELVEFFRIEGFPTFLLGNPLNNEYNIMERIVGADEAALREKIQELEDVLVPVIN